MGYETINYACGHSEQVQMYGKIAERTKRANYLGRYDCPECKAKAAAAGAKDAGLPVLQGSDKQIAWADKLRADFLKNLAESVAKAKEIAKNSGKEIDAILLRALDLQVADILKNTSAQYWIENWKSSTYILITLKKDSAKYIEAAKAEAKAEAEAEAQAKEAAEAQAKEAAEAKDKAEVKTLIDSAMAVTTSGRNRKLITFELGSQFGKSGTMLKQRDVIELAKSKKGVKYYALQRLQGSLCWDNVYVFPTLRSRNNWVKKHANDGDTDGLDVQTYQAKKITAAQAKEIRGDSREYIIMDQDGKELYNPFN